TGRVSVDASRGSSLSTASASNPQSRGAEADAQRRHESTPARISVMATGPTTASVDAFLAAVPDERRRADARRVCELMADVTGERPVMWGASIVGFGSYHYRYASGHEGDAALASLSPRKPHLVVYLVGGFAERHQSALERLGPHRTG